MNDEITIIDLGVGNLANVSKAIDGNLTDEPSEVESASKIILPGVGNFASVMEELNPFRRVILDSIDEGDDFLGICLGMQLLFEESEEGEGKGLGVLKGNVKKMKGVRTPHIGWNRLIQEKDSPLYEGVDDETFFYYVHSYRVEPLDREVIVGRMTVGDRKNKIPAVVQKENVYGVQFHPEKSSEPGLRLLRNFVEL